MKKLTRYIDIAALLVEGAAALVQFARRLKQPKAPSDGQEG